MTRTFSNPVLVGLTQRQVDYLVDNYEVSICGPMDDGSSYSEIIDEFTTDQINKLFDNLEKLED